MRPYLRVANVFEDRIDTTDVKTMHFEPEEFERFRLHPGDILLNEGQSPELLGRPAIYRGAPTDVAFTNTLIRFNPFDGIVPRWALTVFRSHMHSGRFARESRITTNIGHISINRLSTVEFPVPPVNAQERVLMELDSYLGKIQAAASVVGRLGEYSRMGTDIQRRVKALIRSLLAEAISGQLMPQDPNDEPASVLLERIRAERAAASVPRNTRRRSAVTTTGGSDER